MYRWCRAALECIDPCTGGVTNHAARRAARRHTGPGVGPTERNERDSDMAQGEFTKEEADATTEAIDELFKALSKAKQREFVGHLNDISLFISAAKQAAPSSKK